MDCRRVPTIEEQAQELATIIDISRSETIDLLAIHNFADNPEFPPERGYLREFGMLGAPIGRYPLFRKDASPDPYCAVAEKFDRKPSICPP